MKASHHKADGPQPEPSRNPKRAGKAQYNGGHSPLPNHKHNILGLATTPVYPHVKNSGFNTTLATRNQILPKEEPPPPPCGLRTPPGIPQFPSSPSLF
ncbi:hypothetical protein EJ06DRAFT_332819 [Trichodelitschia bisporula]|uniref:Uncharacterized protein n=1 Tax=Trichodelitschia bisporula TaxID=703511 RepID=A0A6G1I2L2_9PEZI|nr:hypothetical protein EJ06DRAFT_332819 [Trichodelitschia bisporula]